MADDKPSRSKAVLGGKKPTTAAEARHLDRVSLERTTNGHIKATHRYRGGEGPNTDEIHALAPTDLLGHLGKAFDLTEEKRAIDAKKANVEAYEKAHGLLTKPAAAPAEAPSGYDKIRARLREKAAQPPASDMELSDRFTALTKSLNR